MSNAAAGLFPAFPAGINEDESGPLRGHRLAPPHPFFESWGSSKSPHMTGFDLEVFPYKNISSFEMGKNLMGHHVSFFASGNKAKVKWIHGDNFQEFVEAVKENMATQGTPSTPQQASSDPMKQLEKLGKLRDSGVVTKEEFESKKAEILSRI